MVAITILCHRFRSVPYFNGQVVLVKAKRIQRPACDVLIKVTGWISTIHSHLFKKISMI